MSDEVLENYEEMSDEELMEAFYACDDDAFEVLAERWRLRLKRWAIGKGEQIDAAEEIASMVLGKLWLTKLSQPS